MLNKNDFVFRVRDLKEELKEATMRANFVTNVNEKKRNEKFIDDTINEILRMSSILLEEEQNRKAQELKDRVTDAENLMIEGDSDDVIGQEKLEKAFLAKFEQIKVKFAQTSLKEITGTQRDMILTGLRDRLGLVPGQDMLRDIAKFNYDQASNTIKVLKKLSFYNQRLQLTTAVKEMRKCDNYEEIVKEVRASINYKSWFDANKDLLKVVAELQPPTDAQVRMIANVSKYIETAETLATDFNIDVINYEYRPIRDGQMKDYYSMNWEKFKLDISDRMNRQSASNFLQTWGYLANQYAGQDLDSHELAHLRGLYMQLGDMESTRPSRLNTINKLTYNYVVADLENQLDIERVTRNNANSKFRENMSRLSTKREARQTVSVKMNDEQQEAKDLFEFVSTIYRVVGQEIPEEMRRILPDSYSQSRQAVYVGIAPNHIKEFRRLVFEQRGVVKKVYEQYNSNDSRNGFNWGAFVASQPMNVLETLGLADMM